VSYQNVPEEALRQGLLSMGIPAPIAEFFIAFFSLIRNGKIYPPISAVADLLGRQPAHLVNGPETIRRRSANVLTRLSRENEGDAEQALSLALGCAKCCNSLLFKSVYRERGV
jgi:hypothetical protein